MTKPKLEQGLIQVYTGNAKGKSTAAFGLAVRAAGNGFKVLIVQFMKTGNYGENKAFARLAPEVEIHAFGRPGFIHRGGAKPEDYTLARKALAFAEEAMLGGDVDILILDEVNNALFFQLLTIEEVLAFLDRKPPHLELVLTGRNASQEIIDRAHLVTEMREIKHPYQLGVNARQGIEF